MTQLTLTWDERVDTSSAESYGRGLRTLFALQLELTAEVMRVQSGLRGHYDGLVRVERSLASQITTLRTPPRFFSNAAQSSFVQSALAAEAARRVTEERVEQFKSEHAVSSNSLRFLPVASRTLDAFVAKTPEEERWKESGAALVRDVLLLQTTNDPMQRERVDARIRELVLPQAAPAALGLVLSHVRVAEERGPRIARLVREIAERPEVAVAEAAVTNYDAMLGTARATADHNAQASVLLALMVVLAAALVIILKLRHAANALRATTGELQQALAALHVEEQKQRELAALKSRFVSMTSHELRTPLAAIMSSSELLEAYADRWPQEKKQEHFGRIQGAVHAMMRMVEGVLMVGRSEAGRLEFKPAPIELRRLCEDAAKTASQALRGLHTIVLDLPEVDEPVVADEALLRHAMDNLLSNAVKYSPRGGRVGLRVKRCDDDIVFEVSDEGIGIPAADQERLFEAFERGSNVGAVPGSGLGLAIAKRAIDLHGGSLGVSSEVGVGTRFTVTLPCPRLSHSP